MQSLRTNDTSLQISVHTKYVQMFQHSCVLSFKSHLLMLCKNDRKNSSLVLPAQLEVLCFILVNLARMHNFKVHIAVKVPVFDKGKQDPDPVLNYPEFSSLTLVPTHQNIYLKAVVGPPFSKKPY